MRPHYCDPTPPFQTYPQEEARTGTTGTFSLNQCSSVSLEQTRFFLKSDLYHMALLIYAYIKIIKYLKRQRNRQDKIDVKKRQTGRTKATSPAVYLDRTLLCCYLLPTPSFGSYKTFLPALWFSLFAFCSFACTCLQGR